jgi:hypothetical protein
MSLPLTILAANFFIVKFFTNRSLYSFFALTFLTTIFYNIILNLINYLASYKSATFSFNKIFLVSLGGQIILNLFSALIIFYIVNFISNKWKPVFLVKR